MGERHFCRLALSWLDHLFFPTACPFCQQYLPPEHLEQQGLCCSCRQTVPFLHHGGEGSRVSLECAAPCFRLYCLGRYAGPLKECILRYKFHTGTWIAKPLGRLLHQMLEENGGYEGISCLTYVPVSGARFAKRGFDQSQLLAQRIGQLSGLPCVPLLSCVAGSTVQSKRNREGRLMGQRRFIPTERVPAGGVLLLDDILTTGSTLRECASLLLEQGASLVKGCVAASGRKDLC